MKICWCRTTHSCCANASLSSGTGSTDFRDASWYPCPAGSSLVLLYTSFLLSLLPSRLLPRDLPARPAETRCWCRPESSRTSATMGVGSWSSKASRVPPRGHLPFRRPPFAKLHTIYIHCTTLSTSLCSRPNKLSRKHIILGHVHKATIPSLLWIELWIRLFNKLFLTTNSELIYLTEYSNITPTTIKSTYIL